MGQPGMPPPGQFPPGGQYPPPPGGDPRKKKRNLLVIGGIVGALILIAGAVFLFMALRSPSFEVGGCIEETDSENVQAVDCDDANADFEIVSEADSVEECDDEGHQNLIVGDDTSDPDTIYCLTPLNGDEDSDSEDQEDSDPDNEGDEDADNEDD